MDSVYRNIKIRPIIFNLFIALLFASHVVFFNSASAKNNQDDNGNMHNEAIAEKTIGSEETKNERQHPVQIKASLSPAQEKETTALPRDDVKKSVPNNVTEKQNFVQNETKPISATNTTEQLQVFMLEDWFILAAMLLLSIISIIFIIHFIKALKMSSYKYSGDKSPAESLSMNSAQKEWLVVGGSAIGNDHVKSSTPCQDYFVIEKINKHWGVAVCCDGAGSAANSAIGSRFVAEKTAKILVYAVEKHGWHHNNELPDDALWRESSVAVFHKVYKDLDNHARDENLDIKSLACTVIAIIYSPIGLLIAHIGDGRAAYCNEAGEWKSIMIPFKGEEANQTVFITSSIWQEKDKYIESRVIKDRPHGFTLLSDGCEDFAFETYINNSKAEGEIKVEDVNRPFDGFYSPVVQYLKGLRNEKSTNESIEADWIKLLDSGSQKIMDEPDDKTMILGVLV